MIPHPFGYIIIILIQQMLIVGMAWAVMRLVERLRQERRRPVPVRLSTNTFATDDLAALAVQLSKTKERRPSPVPRESRESRVQPMQEQRI